MNTAIEIYKLFQTKGILVDKEIIIFKNYCHDFIESCKDLELTILGIDGFAIKNNRTYVNTTEISDFSKTKEDIENCYVLATLFINKMFKHSTSDGYLFTLK
ncbi:MAG: Unknown protein [uncultured Sulfurovum sp.]|uniref:Uncharacterized protein n=1 Tax=uncultured Sulfurovum sp. TaxID=269237 RepID=A0A6S6TBW5_9BACT|nr:MAG: Unknown protein [uncultured Sulfurovum sp.]